MKIFLTFILVFYLSIPFSQSIDTTLTSDQIIRIYNHIDSLETKLIFNEELVKKQDTLIELLEGEIAYKDELDLIQTQKITAYQKIISTYEKLNTVTILKHPAVWYIIGFLSSYLSAKIWFNLME